MEALTLSAEAAVTGILHDPAAFAWWYADGINEVGTGFVCIWSWGLPFMPQLGPATPALRRPSFNLVLYEEGRPVWYLLHALEPEDCSTPPLPLHADGSRRWRFGACTILDERVGNQRSLRLDIDLPQPGSADRLTGFIQLRGSIPKLPEASAGATHRWSPLCLPASATATLSNPRGFRFEFAGRAYADHNASTVPLGELGIEEWTWGHLPAGEDELVHYLVNRSNGGAPVWLSLRASPNGELKLDPQPVVELGAHRRDLFGLRYPTSIRVAGAGRESAILQAPPVDQGPFYLRMPIRDEAGNRGWSELVRPDRLNQAWQAPFIRMKVFRDDGQNSAMVPYFSGPLTQGPARLLATWGGL